MTGHHGLGTGGELQLWESRDEAREFYGKERMMEIIKMNADKPAKAIGHALEADLATFRGSAPILDDVTYVVVKML